MDKEQQKNYDRNLLARVKWVSTHTFLIKVSKIFNTKSIDDIIETGYIPSMDLFQVYIHDHPGPTYADFFDYLYDILLKSYRCEYVYKNEIACGWAETEFRMGKNIADVVFFRPACKSSLCYEIKSEYDSLDRLPKQIEAYKKVFDYISILTCRSKVDAIKKLVDKSIGIMILEENKFTELIMPSLNKDIKLDILFDCLRQPEYINILEAYYEEDIRLPNTKIRSVCKEKFCSMEVNIAHDKAIEQLSKRAKYSELISELPVSLLAYGLTIKTKKKLLKLKWRLTEKIKKEVENE